MKNYGKSLQWQREMANLSQCKLAKLTGISQQNISRWENNDNIPGVDQCEILADFYEISIDELIGREIPKNYAKQINIHNEYKF